jgi:hypothetical protein
LRSENSLSSDGQAVIRVLFRCYNRLCFVAPLRAPLRALALFFFPSPGRFALFCLGCFFCACFAWARAGSTPRFTPLRRADTFCLAPGYFGGVSYFFCRGTPPALAFIFFQLDLSTSSLSVSLPPSSCVSPYGHTASCTRPFTVSCRATSRMRVTERVSRKA